jgi:hypothetical protein
MSRLLLNSEQATGWTTGELGSFPGMDRDAYFLQSVETGPGAHPVSYTINTEGKEVGA